MANFITSFNNLKLLLFVVMFVYMVCFVVVPGFVDMNLIVFGCPEKLCLLFEVLAGHSVTSHHIKQLFGIMRPFANKTMVSAASKC